VLIPTSEEARRAEHPSEIRRVDFMGEQLNISQCRSYTSFVARLAIVV